MRRFLLKIISYVLILTAFPLLEMSLPPTFLAFRHYSAIKFSIYPKGTPYYQNVKSQMMESGDLAPRTKYAIKKYVYWETDKFGFRNSNGEYDPDVIILGDSFTQGSGLNQNETISSMLARMNPNLKIYNCAPYDMNSLLLLIRENKIKKPSLIVYENVERLEPRKIIHNEVQTLSYKMRIKSFIETNNLDIQIDKFLRFQIPRRVLKSLRAIIDDNPRGIQSPLNDTLFFLQGMDAPSITPNIDTVFSRIIGYKEVLKNEAIDFLYVPQPNKESVYYKYVPLEVQPNFISDLTQRLNNSGVPSIDMLNVYKNNFQLNLYQLDDTHWDSSAVYLTAREINKWIRDHNI